jgi:WD40 repeat protein
MRSLRLSEVQRVRFLNAIMESEFRKALETLSLGHDTQKKAVSIHFAGEGKRNVKVGYVIENPIWKTSYRLVLPTLTAKKEEDKQGEKKEKEKKPYLQGWAVVENQTDEDWNGVKMALISGRPISFQMNLYDALFIKRPVVEPELFASLRPVAYSGGMAFSPDGKHLASGSGGNGVRVWSEAEGDAKGGEAKRMKDFAFDQAKVRDREEFAGKLRQDLASNLDLGKSVSSAASASKLGDYFQYAIDHSVNLPRQKSALLPIVGKDVEGERISIYNERTHPKFPLLGLVFKNTTGMHLTQGPITVYEGSTYAGDARILDLQKDERRLLSYAIDLGTEVQAVPHSDNGKITSVKVVKGIVYTKTKVSDSKTYKVVNRNDTDRVVLVEHPNRTDFTLTSKDKPWETASDFHRFKVTAPAGKTVDYVVSEEKEFPSSVLITNSDDQSIRLFINQPVTSPEIKKALEKALSLKGKLSETQREIQQQERQLNIITQDQDRLRKNIKEMPPEAAAYKRYLKKFDDQETEIERLQKLIKELQDGEHAQRKEYESFLANLTVE